jgi:hypothetical protein
MADAKRIRIELPPDLQAWVEEQAAELALDAASWVRMTLQLMRKKQTSVPLTVLMGEQRLPSMQEIVRQVVTVGGDEAVGEPQPEVDTTNVIELALQTAEAQGLDRQPQTFMPPMPDEPMMRSVAAVGERRAWDPYGAKAVARGG